MAWFRIYGERLAPNDFKEKTPRVQYYTMGSNTSAILGRMAPKNCKMTSYYLSSAGNCQYLNGDCMF